MTAQSHPPVAIGLAVDRSAEERTLDGLIDAAVADKDTVVLALARDAAPLAARDALAWMSPCEVPAPDEWAFLGRRPDGRAVLAAVYVDDEPPFDAPGGWGGLRVVGADLDPAEASVFTEALSLARWLRDSPFCPACGTRTDVRMSGWSRHCTSCGRIIFHRHSQILIEKCKKIVTK